MEKKANDVPFTALILGGAGLVGRQVALRLAKLPLIERLVICALTAAEVEAAKNFLLPQLPMGLAVEWEFGNLFVPTHLAHVLPTKLKETPEYRSEVLRSIYDPVDQVWKENHLAQLILKWRPTWIVDSVNTATGISYANTWDSTAKVLQDLAAGVDFSANPADLETLLMSSGIPQLTQHVAILQRAANEVGARMYLKVGTTGTGGMGFNIPYTHGEAKPSRVLMGKNAISGAQMFLLLLLARTPSPSCLVVKAVVPAAMIGYSGIRYGRPLPYKGRKFELFKPVLLDLSGHGDLDVSLDPAAYEQLGNIETTMIGTGENGEFTLEEFRVITAPGQMEMVTAEEVADMVVSELTGRNTGHDVIAGLDAAVVSPSNHGGLLRERALATAEAIAAEQGDFSVALGELGPPQLTKLLYELTLIQQACAADKAELPDDPDLAETLSEQLENFVTTSQIGIRLANTCTSVGVPILLPGGKLLRGPRINLPETSGHIHEFAATAVNVHIWAETGWVDLRPDNLRRWIERIKRIQRTNGHPLGIGNGSDEALRDFARSFKPGEVVAAIFAQEMNGARIK